MDGMDLFGVVCKAIREETERPANEPITAEMSAKDIDGWDSLAHARIMMNIEARIGKEIDLDATYRAATIGELVEVVEQAVKE